MVGRMERVPSLEREQEVQTDGRITVVGNVPNVMALLHSLPDNVAASFDVLLGGILHLSASLPTQSLELSCSHSGFILLFFCPPASGCTQLDLEQRCDGGLLPELSPRYRHLPLISELNPGQSCGSEQRGKQTHLRILGTQTREGSYG